MPLDPTRFAAILFDMDGTLIDSEPIWFDVMRRVLADFGGALPDHAHAELHGTDRDSTNELLRDRYGLNRPPEPYWDRVDGELVAALAQANAMPNAAQWVERAARAEQPLALVSNSPHDMIRASLSRHAWARHLTVRISVEDVPHGKPAPDGYLLAADRLGVDPRQALAVEDSEAGARAAVAAGATCLFVTNGVVAKENARRITPYVVARLPDVGADERGRGG